MKLVGPRIGRSYDELLKEREELIDFNILTKTKRVSSVNNEKITDNRHLNTVLKGSGIQHTTLSLNFFSQKNINNLQNIIRYRLYKETGFKVGRQSDNELITIMRSVFLTYGKNNKNNIKTQIAVLNEILLDEILPNLKVEVISFKKYLKDKATPYQFLERPIHTSSAGTRSMRLDTAIGF